MAGTPKQPTGGDHQKPYPAQLFGHLAAAIEAHLALTVPPGERDTDDDYDEGGNNGV